MSAVLRTATILVLPVLAGCGGSTATSSQPPSASSAAAPHAPAKKDGATSPAVEKRDEHSGADILKALSGFIASVGGGKKPASTPPPRLPDGLALEDACEPATPELTAQLTAAASAAIPLVEGLTLSDIWIRASDRPFEHECLHQITTIDAGGIHSTVSCNYPDGHRDSASRTICASDFAAARYYHNTFYTPHYRDAVRGSTMFTLPVQAFRQLKASGQVPHHYVAVNTNRQPPKVAVDRKGTLQLRGTTRAKVLVNDRPVDLPILRAEGTLDAVDDPSHQEAHASIVVLDDERFPLMLQYGFTDHDYSVRYTKITFPSHQTHDTIETHLEAEEPVDVYGIYFDFASDRLRPESAPVLGEISQVLTRHPDWKLSIAGHTDNIGGAASNLDLSRRRAAAVRDALVREYHIDGGRLVTAGYGLSQPKDTNDTVDGRARNRRVELRRER